MKKIDLHMHSSFSGDGQFTPKELVLKCKEAEVSYFAIADHNSVKGIEEGREACIGTGIAIVPAVELDCVFQDYGFHLLGYGIDGSLEEFYKIEDDIQDQERYNGIERMKKVRELGIGFLEERVKELANGGMITGEMIAQAALEYDKENQNPLLDPYREGGNRCELPLVNFYWDYMDRGKPAYVETFFISLTEAIGVIKRAGGIPILAHPGLQIKENAHLLDQVIMQGVDGIEAYSSYHSEEQTLFYKEYAKEKGILVTCGSDFHGDIKPKISPGSVKCDGREEEILRSLRILN